MVKSRGFGSSHTAFSPLASPRSPWQPAQYLRKSDLAAWEWPVILPMWLSRTFGGPGGRGPTSGASCATALVANPVARIKLRIPWRTSNGFKLFIFSTLKPDQRRRIEFVSGPSWLEIEIKSRQNFAAVDVCAGQRRCSDLVEQVELVMPGETGTAGHERVITIADGVGRDIAKVRAHCRHRLLRHLDRFISREEDELRTVNVVRLDENAIPGRVARAGDQLRSWRVVARLLYLNVVDDGIALGGWVIDKVTIALPEPRAIRSVLRDNLHIKLLSEIELPHEAFAAEALVVGS